MAKNNANTIITMAARLFLVLVPLLLLCTPAVSSAARVPTTDADKKGTGITSDTTIAVEGADNQSCLSNLGNKDGTCATFNGSSISRTQPSTSSAAQQQQQQQQPLECGLYLATSSIPNSGWGMYTGFPIVAGDVIPPVDVVIPVADHKSHVAKMFRYRRLEKTYGTALNVVSSTGRMYPPPPISTNNSSPLEIKKIPKWLMDQYYWDPGMTHNIFDAEYLESVVPGLGMLANSHPGMVLAENVGPQRPSIIGGLKNPASTPYQDQAFVATMDIPAGHELFVEYGDDWFADRFPQSFGLSPDYKLGNKIAELWQRKILDTYYFRKYEDNQSIWQDLADTFLGVIEPLNPRMHDVLSRLNLLPKEGDNTHPFVASNNPTAYASVPDAPQSTEWLQENGLCLDHITIAESTVAPGDRGAFASRFLPKGTIVSPAPVVHMSRDHLTMLLMDSHDTDMVRWKGYQLLLNYVYGHVESSLLLFPYAPAVNLINHHGGEITHNKRPNVKLQWSSKMPHPEWLESWTPEQIIQETHKAGLVMEIVALEDIPEGAEILLDYGEAWQAEWENHAATMPPPPELPYVEWNEPQLLTINDNEQYPSIVQTVCWIHDVQAPSALYEAAQKAGDGGQLPDTWLPWMPTKTTYVSDANPCTIVGRLRDGAFYNVIVDEEINDVLVEVRITNVPRRAITIVPAAYIGAELRRDAFRHEIQLPDEMVPEHWRDLKVIEHGNGVQDQCHLYMAESVIPNAGWGLYRGYAYYLSPNATDELDHFCEDMIIHVEDFALNQKLRNQFFHQDPDPEMDDWLLSRYAWSGDMTMGGNLEADDVQALAPGCGMLANSHPLLYNTNKVGVQRAPAKTTNPSLGATTHYHRNVFVEQYMKINKIKTRTMQNGIEILVKSDNDFFEALDVPLRSEYVAADRVLRRLLALKKTHGTKAAGILWKLLWNTLDAFNLKRKASIIPKDMEKINEVLAAGGTAFWQLPDRTRRQDWLEKEGNCVDNIRPGASTVELAGQGAFASRSIARGKVIAPLPMIHLHRKHMDIYNSKNISDPAEAVWFERKQLIMNYCYGHPESSLLLFPYSPFVNYINHAPSDGSNDQATMANAKLQWSSQFNSKEWLQKSPEDLLRNHKRAGLAMEVVATRDIAPGEEIFLDYGKHWQAAWENHTTNWNWKDAEDWTRDPPNNQWFEWMPTEDEIYDRNLHLQFHHDDKFLGCYVKVPDLPPVDKASDELPEFKWEHLDGMFRTTQHVYPCQIIERKVESGDEEEDIQYEAIRKDSVAPFDHVYTAVITVDNGSSPQQFICYNMPRRAIEIFDAGYTSPQFFNNGFRREIGIPDDLLPDVWRDLKS